MSSLGGQIAWYENIGGDASGWIQNAVAARKDSWKLPNILWVDIDGDGQKEIIYAEPLSIIMFKKKYNLK